MKLSNLINPQDYKEYRYLLTIKNETSQVTFNKSDVLKILELGENYITIEGPKNLCQVGHQVSLRLTPNFNQNSKKKSGDILIVAKVSELFTDTETNQTVWKALFTQYDLKEWERVHKFYESRQEKINSMILLGR